MSEILHVLKCLPGLWYKGNAGEISRQLQVFLFVVLQELQLHGHFARRLLCHSSPTFPAKNNALNNRSGCLTFIFADDTIISERDANSAFVSIAEFHIRGLKSSCSVPEIIIFVDLGVRLCKGLHNVVVYQHEIRGQYGRSFRLS